MNPFIDIDTPEKAYWAGYLALASLVDGDDTLITSSNEVGHLHSLEVIIPQGDVGTFEVDAMGERVMIYETFQVVDPSVVESFMKLTVPPSIVRKLARDYIRGMMDARPVWEWSMESIDLDLPLNMADYVMEFMPYLHVEHLFNGRMRLYTNTRWNTYRALTYLYRDTTVAKSSRKSVYDGL